MIFIPAIDLIDGKCVRLSQGDYSKKTQYNGKPLDIARYFRDQGARWLHVVDLDAARDAGTGNREIIRELVRAVDIPVEVGGGVRDRESIQLLLDAGVRRVILGTVIVKNEEYVEELVCEFGKKLVAGIDARDGAVRVSGWMEESYRSAVDLGRRVKDLGFSLIIYTDISRDGMLMGPNVDEVRRMALETGLPIIAAGGISSIDDIRVLKTLQNDGVIGVISGKAVYEGKLSVRDACDLLQRSV